MNEKDAVQAWYSILKTVLSLPGARVNRDEYLRKELLVYYDEAIVQKSLDSSPKKAGVTEKVIDIIAEKSIKFHTKTATTASFVTGLPGGLAMLGTIPADIAQLYYNAIVVTQKIAYLYGWPDFNIDEKETDEDILNNLTVFLGVMHGVNEANKIIAKLSENLAKEVVKKLPRKALTKYYLYNLTKQVCKALGIKLTKTSFAKGVGKVVPIIGGAASGTITYFTMKPMCSRLKKNLKDCKLNTIEV